MKFAALIVLASAWGIATGLSLSLSLSFSSSRWPCPPSTLTHRQLVTRNSSPLLHNPQRSAITSCCNSNARPRTGTTRLYAVIEEGESPANALLKMVDVIAKCKTSSDQIEKMEELEKILTQLVENEKAVLRQQQKMKQEPHPPEMPPPMGALLLDDEITTTSTTTSADVDLQKAELALAQLRERLALEEANLMQAEKALRQSREEAETLRKAEVELLEKKKGAEQRMAEAIRRTKAFVESTEEARKKLVGKQQQQQKQKQPPKQPASKITNKYQVDQDAASKTNSRPTIALQQFFATGGAPNWNNSNNSNNSGGGGGKGALLNAEFPPGARMAAAPPSVPTLYDWKLNGDGTVTGSVKGSTMFREGAIVTTSRLAVRCEAGTLVSTSSGSK
jgi:hypothetical protein